MVMTVAKKSLADQFLNERRVSTPIIQLRTADAEAVMRRLTEASKDDPVIQWDPSAGFQSRNKVGAQAISAICGKETQVLNPGDAVFSMRKAPDRTMIFLLNAQLVWKDAATIQGIWNLRDNYKAHMQTLVLLTTLEAQLPRELEGDVIVLEDPLPDAKQIEEIIIGQCENAQPPLPKPNAATLAKATDAMKGLAPFIVEQSVASALTRKGVDVASLWQHKKIAVRATAGATVYEGTEKFADIGGHDGLKLNLSREINSKKPVKVVVIFDEFEKMIAGASSDHVGDGGVAKDASQVVLTYMQDHKVRGTILFGHPGAGKTAVAKAMGNEADCLVIQADMGAMRGGIVGESEARVRAFFNMISAIAGEGGAFFVATCNSTGAITTELRRRFKSGFYFVDLPDASEKAAIWKIKMAQFGIDKQTLPNDTNWTGSEIENCCEKADNYGISLIEAAKLIVPVAQSQPELIERRRREAHKSMLSAATGETYLMPEAEDEANSGMVGAYAAGAARRVRTIES